MLKEPVRILEVQARDGSLYFVLDDVKEMIKKQGTILLSYTSRAIPLTFDPAVPMNVEHVTIDERAVYNGTIHILHAQSVDEAHVVAMHIQHSVYASGDMQAVEVTGDRFKEDCRLWDAIHRSRGLMRLSPDGRVNIDRELKE